MDSYIASESSEILKHKETLLKERGINPYKTLGISKKSSSGEAKKAYENICLELERSPENVYFVKGKPVSLEEIEYSYDYIFFRLFSEKYTAKTNTHSTRNVNSMNDSKSRNEILYGIEDEESMKMEKEIKKFQEAEKIPVESMLNKFKSSSGSIMPVNAPDHTKFISPKTKKFNVKKFMESFEDYSRDNADVLLKNHYGENETGFKASESYCEGTVKGMNIKYCDGMIIPTKDVLDIPGADSIREISSITTIPKNCRQSVSDKYAKIPGKGNMKKNLPKGTSRETSMDIKAAFASKKKELEENVYIERKSYAQAEHEMLEYRKKMNEKEKKNMKENIGKHFGIF
jgi:hypothetical protein